VSVTKRTRPYALNLVTVQKYKSQEDKGRNNCSSLPVKLSSVLVPALAPAQTTGMNSHAFMRARLKSHFEHVFQRISPIYKPGLKKLPSRAPPCSVNDSRLPNWGSLFPISVTRSAAPEGWALPPAAPIHPSTTSSHPSCHLLARRNAVWVL